jgi:two-component system, OmpR family, response regulator VicR
MRRALDVIDNRQPHILVLNDSQEILDLLQELLEEEGYRVSTSITVLNLEKLKAIAPDLIVQDLLFEGMHETGWTFLTMSRLDPDLARVPLVLCTAAVTTIKDPDMAEQLKRLGVRIVLKPFDITQLLATIAECLATGAADFPAKLELPEPTMIHEGGAFALEDDGNKARQHR